MFYVEDVVRGQWSPANRNKIMKQTAQIDKARHKYASVKIVVEQEPGSGGKESALLTIQDLAGFSVFADKVSGQQQKVLEGVKVPGKAKVIRALPLAAQAEAGNVCIVAGPWVKDWLEEVCLFPLASHDDQVDATSGALAWLAPQRVMNEDDALPKFGRAPRKNRKELPNFARRSVGKRFG